MANSADPDQIAPSGAVWSGSALFAYAILSETLVYEILGHLPYNFYLQEPQCEKMNLLTCATNGLESACASVQSDQSSLTTWRNLASLAIQNAPSEDFDQTVRICRLILILAGCKCPKACFLMLHHINHGKLLPENFKIVAAISPISDRPIAIN